MLMVILGARGLFGLTLGFGVENHDDGRSIVEMSIKVTTIHSVPFPCRCVDRLQTPLFQGAMPILL